jgi:RNA polymerase primary sigma factor
MGKIFVTTGAVFSDVASTKLYMSEIKRVKLLTQAEEKSLANRIKGGDESAVNELVSANLRFVVQVAKQYQGMGVELEDLIGFGNLGLFEAAKRFEADRGIKFISFAVWYVRAELQKALNDTGRTVRIPSHKTMTEEYSTISTGLPIGEGENSETYADRYLPAEKETPQSALLDLKYDLTRALKLLKPKQKSAIEMFYGIGYDYPKPMEQIAIELSITGERARQLVRQAELGLKKMSGIKLLEQYL